MIGYQNVSLLREQLHKLADDKILMPTNSGLMSKRDLHRSLDAIYSVIRQHQVVITQIKWENSSKENRHEECVVLENISPVIADLSGWRLNAGTEQDYIFPAGTHLPGGEEITVWTFDQNKPYSFKSHRPVWNNRGDSGKLYNHEDQLVSALCYGTAAHADIVISHINFDGTEGRAEADEYIEITNIGGTPADLSGWTVNAGKQQDFVFPEGTVLLPKGSLKVYTNKIEPESGGFSFERKSAIWNNAGDCGRLYDPNQKLVVEYCY